MTRRDWLRHPAKTIPPPVPTCPRGIRYTTREYAAHGLIFGMGYHGLVEQLCDLGCGGWHIVDRAQAEAGEDAP